MKEPAYAAIADALRRGITSGAVPEGAVLLEGPVAAIFGSSRSPVKQAFAALHEEGLLSRFDGRGFAVGPAEAPVCRITITPEMLSLEPERVGAGKVFAWEERYYEVERDIILRSVFGRFRVNELALARSIGAGRTVAHDLLMRAQQVGIVAKGERSHWWTVPIDEARLRNLYEVRTVLEPIALRGAVGSVPPPVLKDMGERLEAVARRPKRATVADLDRLETDLHVTCLGHSRNPELGEALGRTRCTMVLGKHLDAALGRMPFTDSLVVEHSEVVEAMSRGRPAQAAAALLAHLQASREKAVERLATVRARVGGAPVPYLLD